MIVTTERMNIILPMIVLIIPVTRRVSVGPLPVNPEDGRAWGKTIATECTLVILGLTNKLIEKTRSSIEIIKINIARMIANIRRHPWLHFVVGFSF